jgi:hypothetical protein
MSNLLLFLLDNKLSMSEIESYMYIFLYKPMHLERSLICYSVSIFDYEYSREYETGIEKVSAIL